MPLTLYAKANNVLEVPGPPTEIKRGEAPREGVVQGQGWYRNNHGRLSSRQPTTNLDNQRKNPGDRNSPGLNRAPL